MSEENVSGEFTKVPNRKARREQDRLYGIARPERSRCRRLSRKARAWRR